jgi:hypothetical protein
MRRSSVVPGSPEDRTISGFLIRKDMSKPAFYRLPKKVRDALITVYGPRTLRISPKAEAKFDRDRARPNSTEQRLLQKMQVKRTAVAKKAAAASVVSRSKKRRSRS